MNAVMEAIKERWFIRFYDANPVPRDVLKTVIEAGNEAPSAMNSQPWRFVVIEDLEAKKKVLRAALPRAKRSAPALSSPRMPLAPIHPRIPVITPPD